MSVVEQNSDPVSLLGKKRREPGSRAHEKGGSAGYGSASKLGCKIQTGIGYHILVGLLITGNQARGCKSRK